MQFLNLEPLARSIKLVIGLFCYENFDYPGLMRGKIEDELGFKPEEISKFEVEGNEVLIHLKGKIFRVNLEDIEEYVHPSCAICPDFVNELADISVGSVGSPEGWSTVIIRSDTGEKIFSALENSGMIEVREVGKEGVNELVRMAKLKRVSSTKEVERREKEGEAVPLREKKTKSFGVFSCHFHL